MQPTTEIGNQHPGSGACSPVGEATWATADYPLGAHVQGEDVTFAVYSRHATRILLEIYDSPVGRASAGRRPTAQAAQADDRDGCPADMLCPTQHPNNVVKKRGLSPF